MSGPLHLSGPLHRSTAALRPRPVVVAALLGLTCVAAFSAASAVRPSPAPRPGASARPATTLSPPVPAAPTRTAVLTRPQFEPTVAQLPRGGTTIFPRYRLVGFSGGPGSAAFGRLGIGNIDQQVDDIERFGRQYARGRQPMPVLELIADVAQTKPGPDGKYHLRVEPDVVHSYLAAARRHRALLLLNIQPGRADFLPEVKAFLPWLRQPDVGVALDPEWAVGPGQVPGRVFGSTTGKEVDGISAFLQKIVTEQHLPQKVLVVHQLAVRIWENPGAVKRRPGVVVVKSVDGIGSRADKTVTWNKLVVGLPPVLHPGFKLFFTEDGGSRGLMTPAQVLALRPTPEYVLYE
jgi:hypothetical protein